MPFIQINLEETIRTAGLAIELTTSQSKNFEIIQGHWKVFNHEIKINGLNQAAGNWVKYGFTYKVNERYFYLAAIPFVGKSLPDYFIVKNIPAGNYAVFSHQGKLEAIKNTFTNIYKNELPQSGLKLVENSAVDFIVFEKYDQRFHWNQPNSVIDIYIPIL
jgi:predicted transcriptional regulator YdeE